MSDMIPSVPDCEDEWSEDDLEDLEPLRPGGEPGGASVANEVISSSALEEDEEKMETSVSERGRVWVVVILGIVGLVQWQLMRAESNGTGGLSWMLLSAEKECVASAVSCKRACAGSPSSNECLGVSLVLLRIYTGWGMSRWWTWMEAPRMNASIPPEPQST